eukprot:SAG31_NODE_437_length_15714_cov_8.527344_13_plen_240_part_00
MYLLLQLLLTVAVTSSSVTPPASLEALELDRQLERLENLHSAGLISDAVWERRQDALLDELLLRPVAPPTPPRFPISFNVMDYGATGDGATDDSDAIQAALTAASKYVSREQLSMWGPSVLFPHGQYAINRTLFIQAGVALLGADEAIIYQRNSSADIFYSSYIWRFRMERLRLSGTSSVKCIYLDAWCVVLDSKSPDSLVPRAQGGRTSYISAPIIPTLLFGQSATVSSRWLPMPRYA